eukprot:1075744-Rhodomonas_salina.1
MCIRDRYKAMTIGARSQVCAAPSSALSRSLARLLRSRALVLSCSRALCSLALLLSLSLPSSLPLALLLPQGRCDLDLNTYRDRNT